MQYGHENPRAKMRANKALTAGFSNSTTASCLSKNTSTRLTGAIFSKTCCKRPSCVAGGRFLIRTDLFLASATRLRPISDLVTQSTWLISLSMKIKRTCVAHVHEGLRGWLLSSVSWARGYWRPKLTVRLSKMKGLMPRVYGLCVRMKQTYCLFEFDEGKPSRMPIILQSYPDVFDGAVLRCMH